MASLPARSGLALSLLALSCFAGTATASADTTADLSVTAPQQDTAEERTPGSITNYSFYVSNLGPDATEASATVTLGDAEELVSVGSGRGSCTESAPVVCSLGSVAPGGQVMVTVQVRFTRASSTNGNHVRVSGPGTNVDPDTSNDQAAALSPVAAGGDSTEGTPVISTGEWLRSQSRLRVEADVTPNGAGKMFFEYGRTRDYGSKTDARAVSGSAEKTVKSVLAGLKMSTLYHYRAVLVVGGKTYYGKNVKARTLGVLKYGPLTLKAANRSPKSVRYVGALGDGLADAPGACKGTVTVTVYTLAGADLLRRTTRMRSDCTYAITIPFGRSQASKYGKKGSVLTQARFSGNKAVSSVGSESDRP